MVPWINKDYTDNFTCFHSCKVKSSFFTFINQFLIKTWDKTGIIFTCQIILSHALSSLNYMASKPLINFNVLLKTKRNKLLDCPLASEPLVMMWSEKYHYVHIKSKEKVKYNRMPWYQNFKKWLKNEIHLVISYTHLWFSPMKKKIMRGVCIYICSSLPYVRMSLGQWNKTQYTCLVKDWPLQWYTCPVKKDTGILVQYNRTLLCYCKIGPSILVQRNIQGAFSYCPLIIYTPCKN